MLFALLVSHVSAREFSSLEERMSAAEFRAAGLDKLSAEELAALNAWIRGDRALAPATGGAPLPQSVAETDRRGLSNTTGYGDVIESRIQGKFKGWNGTRTTFELENGMVWKSTDPAAKLAVNLVDPVVRITPGFMDAWFLQVEGYNAKVRVKRLK
ncbi:hypothetical protein [Pseudomarimonas salicorniae]|uniref:Secreted protein n=1 Tax=Pseudomarimonas salicorniae TaxID=2933270 RepID=A0ABT0GH71_9GAMM|nr:hypothetical protein [Lysobacter sp. CAU 1642]MCK7593889.1 hypothetical protein [Lysobacter sp. CAU 1642]